MKKLLCIVLALLMMVSVLSLVACSGTTTPTDTPKDETPKDETPKDETPKDETPKTLKFGMGVAIGAKATDATVEKDGSCEVDSTVAMITVDADGKVVACKIDVAQIKGSWKESGVVNATTEFRTKGEKGNDYGMSKTGKKEWFEQAAAFEGVVIGKTLDEIKALVAEGGKGTEAVTTAGCTITVSDFVVAIEKAFANLADSNATAASTLKLGMATEQAKQTDATSEADGAIEFDTTIFAAVVDADGKILAVDTDCVQFGLKISATGASNFDASAEVLSKRQKGDAYGMSKIGKTEWYAQADAFETQCIGKTIAEVATLVAASGKGTEAVQTAGCTITVSGFVAAALKTEPAPEPETLKFGMGVSISAKASDATVEKDGSCEVDSTVAVITVDADGKVVACKIDVAQIKGSWKESGVVNATTDFRTKGEKGNDYGMSKTGKTEWYAQAAAFEGVVIGKTLAEIEALVAENGKGTDDVITAGCTISVGDFINAIVAAFDNLADSNATAASTLKLGMATEQAKQTDATGEADGAIEFDTTIFAAAVDADGKVIAVDTDCVQFGLKISATGMSNFDETAEILSKRQKGDAYGMSKIGKTEWYAQANAFETQCIGKTVAEIAALVGADGKGTEAVQTAGCTITVSGFIVAALKTWPH